MPPNILLFVTDDHGPWSLGCYGNSEIRSPNFDRLAAEGVRFANAFTPCPVSSPARACLMTGRTPSQVGIHDWLQEDLPYVAEIDWLHDEITLPQLLQQAGYATGLVGKWHLGTSHICPRGFDYLFGMVHGNRCHIGECRFSDQGNIITFTGNRTAIYTDRAISFIEGASRARPWFLHVGYQATHSPYDNQDPELYASYADATFRDIPPYVPHPWHYNEGLRKWTTHSDDAVRHARRSYYAAVTDIDRHLGRILQHLAQTRQAENTLVIYVSDHGCAMGHHGFWGKGNSTRPLNVYDVSLRVPLIMRWPGHIPAGRVEPRCVDHYDHFRALCEVAGIDLSRRNLAARHHPGRSLLPLALSQDVSDWPETKFGEYGDLRMIRTPTHKFVRRYPHGPDELFHLGQDPHEYVNLLGQTEAVLLRADLEKQLDAFYAAHEDPAKSGLRVKDLPRHNENSEAWRDGVREARGLQLPG